MAALSPSEVDHLRVQVMQAGRKRTFGVGVVAALLDSLDKAHHDLALERAKVRDGARLLAESELRRVPRGW